MGSIGPKINKKYISHCAVFVLPTITILNYILPTCRSKRHFRNTFETLVFVRKKKKKNNERRTRQKSEHYDSREFEMVTTIYYAQNQMYAQIHTHTHTHLCVCRFVIQRYFGIGRLEVVQQKLLLFLVWRVIRLCQTAKSIRIFYEKNIIFFCQFSK